MFGEVTGGVRADAAAWRGEGQERAGTCKRQLLEELRGRIQQGRGSRGGDMNRYVTGGLKNRHYSLNQGDVRGRGLGPGGGGDTHR